MAASSSFMMPLSFKYLTFCIGCCEAFVRSQLDLCKPPTPSPHQKCPIIWCKFMMLTSHDGVMLIKWYQIPCIQMGQESDPTRASAHAHGNKAHSDALVRCVELNHSTSSMSFHWSQIRWNVHKLLFPRALPLLATSG